MDWTRLLQGMTDGKRESLEATIMLAYDHLDAAIAAVPATLNESGSQANPDVVCRAIAAVDSANDILDTLLQLQAEIAK